MSCAARITGNSAGNKFSSKFAEKSFKKRKIRHKRWKNRKFILHSRKNVDDFWLKFWDLSDAKVFSTSVLFSQRRVSVDLVDLVKSFPKSIYLQKSASIQTRTSLSTFVEKFNSLFIRLLVHKFACRTLSPQRVCIEFICSFAKHVDDFWLKFWDLSGAKL